MAKQTTPKADLDGFRMNIAEPTGSTTTGRKNARPPKEAIPGFYWEPISLHGRAGFVEVAPYVRHVDAEAPSNGGVAPFERAAGSDLPLWIGVSIRKGPGDPRRAVKDEYMQSERVPMLDSEVLKAVGRITAKVQSAIREAKAKSVK